MKKKKRLRIFESSEMPEGEVYFLNIKDIPGLTFWLRADRGFSEGVKISEDLEVVGYWENQAPRRKRLTKVNVPRRTRKKVR